ncbi:acetyl-CoA decarbonylase/synthase complex subunit gamma [Acetoanaerobium noterae]|jgi:acetyl-CoA decarbonylase/synthase complex subunit gamma|uniref:acetyl-CoA decarbonylase/synthase complex subunit gamma n=1 Tax=Acetoanaerobium noterae TaxID=745369 RepID=UPI001B539165|nr:acetyl-CoA decarbonylase/synthase complex subunit gamma [Acetoanaerobium noterae]MBP8762804.1 acetyl-CoA decarbonylase/synthase complex subunit gamma [Acetoanaerobium sp.]MDK2803274.1 acetyl-CoA decarbonylase/synthase, complex subunit gamma [Peptostreptococcaceae bacterium]
MALTGLDIFKLTPKKNCKDCGFPTCLAFSMKVAAGGIEIEKCPHMSEENLSKLSESTAPPMKALTVGAGANEYKLGGETVLFRHEKTLVNRNRFAVAIKDTDSADVVNSKIENIKKVDFERIGERMKAEFAAFIYTGNKEAYIANIKAVLASGAELAYMVVCEDVEVAKEALELLKDTNPILHGATAANYEQMVDVAAAGKYALGLRADSLEDLYELTSKVQSKDYKELLLDAGSKTIKEAYTNAIQIRRTALKDGDRTFGYPSIIFVNDLAKDNKFMEIALSSIFTIKYGSILVIEDMDFARGHSVWALRQNIYTDPQRPMRVEPKAYSVNNANDESPVLCTVDFALTYFIINGEIEKSKVPTWLLIPDAGGYSVLTAWAAGKFSGSIIANFVKESGVEQKTKSRKLIIPGKVAVLKGDIEDSLPGWEVVVGPNESMQLPKFLKDLYQNA